VRALLGIFILILAASAQSAGALVFSRMHVGIDFLLVCCICCALLAGEGAALTVAVCAGLFKDALSCDVAGHSVAVFVAISLMICGIRSRLWVIHWSAQAGCAFTGTLCAWMLYNLLAKAWGQPLEWAVGAVLSRACVNACIAPPLFRIWLAVVR